MNTTAVDDRLVFSLHWNPSPLWCVHSDSISQSKSINAPNTKLPIVAISFALGHTDNTVP